MSKKITFKYTLDKEEVLREKAWINSCKMQGLLNAVLNAGIWIIDADHNNSFYTEQTLPGFCGSFLAELEYLNQNPSYEGLIFDMEGEYVFRLHLRNGELVISAYGKEYCYDFKIFKKEFKKFCKKVMSEVEFFHPELIFLPAFHQLKQSILNEV